MSYGYENIVFKSTTSIPSIRIPRSNASDKDWKKIAEFKVLALGVTALETELGWDNPSKKPPNIKVEWRKAGGSDPSKRKGLTVGTERAGADAYTTIEKIEFADLPISLWIWHDAPRTTSGTAPDPASDLQMTKVIVKAWNPIAQLQDQIEDILS